MTERGIIFSGPMVRALLDGRKTQTRRLAVLRNGKQNPMTRWQVGDRCYVRESFRAEELSRPDVKRATNRRERELYGRTSVVIADELDGADGLRYAADDLWQRIANTPEAAEAWGQAFHYRGRGKGLLGNPIPAIHMPRWASRLTLTVEQVRVEPLQSLTEADAIAEGLVATLEGWASHRDGSHWGRDPQNAYRVLWDSLHDEDGTRWGDNPQVVAITFAVTRGNIDLSERGK